MKSTILPAIFILSAIAIFISACTIEPAGPTINTTYNHSAFNAVEYGGYGNIYVTQSDTYSLVIETDNDTLSRLRIENNDGKLEIYQRSIIPTGRKINIYVSMPNITELSLAGSGQIISQSRLDVEELLADLDGSGNIILDIDAQYLKTSIAGSGNAYLNGSAIYHESTIAGSGRIYAFNLTTEQTAVSISGSGSAQLTAATELNISIAGSGDVQYIGTPILNPQITGSGRITRIDANTTG